MPQTQTARDWWERCPDHASLSAEAWRRQPAMSQSEEARWLDGCRLAEVMVKKPGKKTASRTVRES